MPEDHSNRRIFILHADYDIDFAQALKDLLLSWEFDAFFGRPENRQLGGEHYRREVSALIGSATIAIPILSNAFRHSIQCQAECGIVFAKGKFQVPIFIPPIAYGNYREVSPMVEFERFIDGSGLNFASVLRETLNRPAPPAGKVGDRDSAAEKHLMKAAEVALADLVTSYEAMPPKAELTGVWPSGLTDKDAMGASTSIAAHLRRAVTEGTTNVALVGVSLKYSLKIITEALESLAALNRVSDEEWGPLNIELTHVDDQAHVLHSIEDSADIRSVIDFFRVGWADIKQGWESAANRAGVQINISEPAAIDYIPQQVGIRIHGEKRKWSVLYAGQCAFENAGRGSNSRATKLRVGEGEYAFYSDSLPSPYQLAFKTRGSAMIDVFNQYVQHYSEPRHNDGAAVLGDHVEWIRRLQECLSTYVGINDLVLFSDSCTKFQPLIRSALERNCNLHVYVTSPEVLSEEKAAHVRSLKNQLPIGSLHYLSQQPTFRVAVVGDSLLGLEPYAPSLGSEYSSATIDDTRSIRELAPSGLRLIVTKHSAHFRMIRKVLTEQCARASLA